MKRLFAATLVLLFAPAADALAQSTPQTVESAPLRLESKIPLGNVKGRIDHMAVDSSRQRLLIAELGNDSLGVVDLKGRKLLRTITGLREPQGVGYAPSTDTVYVANAGDGSVRLFRSDELSPAGRIDLGEDADNIRVDADKNQVFVGYSGGAIAVIDPTQGSKTADMALKAHPESFQLSDATGQIYVNLPSAHAIGVLDRLTGQHRASWPMRGASGNFAMALDDRAQHVIVAFRDPARLAVFAMKNGAPVAERDTCGDSDDIFLDAKRKHVYVVCGAGYIDIFDAEAGAYRLLARIPTAPGARTALFIPALDLLALAVRASGKEAASLWLFRPVS